MPITVKHSKTSAIPDAGDSTLVQPSDWNADHTLTGLGTMAEQNANAVAITGGTISGVTIPASYVTGTLQVNQGGTGATTLTGYVKGAGTTALTASSTIPNTDITGLGTASTKDAGVALGVATLDAGGKVPVSELPAAVLGALSYQGTWDASTNNPTLTSSVGTKGYYYVVSVAGNTNLNGITDWLVGDWAVYNGSIWQKVDNTETVTSVNGQTGAVVLTTTNIAEGTNEYFTTAKARLSVSAGTGISYNNTTGVITNSSPSLGGDVVGPSSATDNAITRFDTTTGKLLQNSVVLVGDTGVVTGVTELTASTKVVSPHFDAQNSAGGALRNASGTAQLQWGGGGGNNLSVDVAININPANAQVAISPTGTGSVAINPATAGTMNNMVIGGTTPLAITGTTITATSFVGSGASLTNVVNSATAGTGISVSASTGAVTITNTAPDQTVSIASGTGISATGTYPAFTVTNTGVTSAVAGTGISVSSGTGAVTVTNTAPDQTVAISSGTGISVTGTYPNFTVTNTSPSSGGTVTSVAALTLGTSGTDLSSTVANGTTTPVITLQVPTASATNRGALSSADWTTFNGKANAFTYTTNYIPFGQGTTTPNQSANLTFDGTTQSAPVQRASNGIVTNNKTIGTSFTIPATDNAMSSGPVTISGGVTVTVSSGSRWVVL